MSRFLAIDTDLASVHVIAGTTRGSTVKLEEAITVALSEPLSPTNAAELGKQLRDALRTAGIAAAPVVAAVGRDRVILKDIKIPKVAPADEPAIVRFQASRDQSESPDSVILDYYTLDRPEADGQVRAVIASVRKDVLVGAKAFCLAAGLKLANLTTRPLGTLAALDRAIASGAVTAPEAKRASIAILTRGEKWGELLIARDGQPVFSRSITGTALNSEQMLLGELRRNLAVYNGQNPQQAVEAVYVVEAAGAAGGWSGRIRAGLTVPVQAFDPLAGVEHETAADARGNFAALAGLLQLKTQTKALPIDFATPRQAVSRESINRKYVAMAASVLALFVIGGLGYGYITVEKRQTELAKLVKEKNDLEKMKKDLDDDKKRIDTLKDWDDMRINWLEEMYDLAARFPDIATTRLEYFRAEPLTPQKGSKTKNVARMFLKVQTESGKFMDALQAALTADKRYHNIRKDIKGGAGTGAPSRFNQSYEVRADIEKRPTSEYIHKLTAAIPPNPGRAKEDAEGSGFPAGGGFRGGFGGPQP